MRRGLLVGPSSVSFAEYGVSGHWIRDGWTRSFDVPLQSENAVVCTDMFISLVGVRVYEISYAIIIEYVGSDLVLAHAHGGYYLVLEAYHGYVFRFKFTIYSINLSCFVDEYVLITTCDALHFSKSTKMQSQKSQPHSKI